MIYTIIIIQLLKLSTASKNILHPTQHNDNITQELPNPNNTSTTDQIDTQAKQITAHSNLHHSHQIYTNQIRNR